jgi:ribosomal protein S18 acetylase RimI-like enzyme
MEDDFQIVSYHSISIDPKSIEKFITACEEQDNSQFRTKADIKAYTSKLIDLADMLLIMNDRGIVGLIAGYNNDVENKSAFISYLGVGFEYRRRGIGRALLKAMMDLSVRRGMHTTRLETQFKNTSALALYQSEGLVIQNVKKDGGIKNAVLIKNLVSGISTARGKF